jgi:hypothetical protein
MAIAPGFYRGPLQKYLKSEGVNRSFLLDLVTTCPAEARYNQEQPIDTASTRLGSAEHCALLEPKRFEREYVILPGDCQPGSGAGMKARKEAFEAWAFAGGQTIITSTEMQNIREMQSVIESDQNCIGLLKTGEAELSGYYIEPEFNVLCKFRTDWKDDARSLVVDLKTAKTVQHFPFRSSAYDHGYDIQAYLGLRGLKILTGEDYEFKFIVIASKGFHGLKVYEADPDLLKSGEDRYFHGLELYTECLKVGIWDRYDSRPQPLGVPEFRRKQLIEGGNL